MDVKTKPTDTTNRDSELEEELAGILTAISIVSKRLAKKLSKQNELTEEGGISYEESRTAQ